MGYATEAILRDLNGDPIPQYFDVVADEFKPLTEAMMSEDYYGTSASVKPTPEAIGAAFYEFDTRTYYIWDGATWAVWFYV